LGKGGHFTTRQNPYSVHELYDKYSGMLFGYIHAAVEDTMLAEQHLASFYTGIKGHLHEINAEGANTWCQLRRLAKEHLSANFTNITGAGYAGNKCLDMMTSEQKQVFCKVYYHGKTIAELSYALNKPEGLVRKDLKDAFTILKQRT
jgi:hypothetical protein